MSVHGGNLRALAARAGRPADEILDFSASINPLGPPQCLRSVISRAVESLVHYPDPDCSELTAVLAQRHGVRTEEIAVGNGSTELLYAVPRATQPRRAIVPVPSYADYARACELVGVPVREILLREERGFELDWCELCRDLRGGELVILGQPNNPTGVLLDRASLLSTVDAHPRTIFVVDEAFAEFVDGCESAAAPARANLIAVRSLTKFYAIPGLRLGYAVADARMAERLRQLVLPWSVNSLAQAAGCAVLKDEAYSQETRRYVATERERLTEALRRIDGLKVYPSCANYLLVKVERTGRDAVGLAEELLRGGIAVRVCENFHGLNTRFFRVAVRTKEQNDRLVDALERSFRATSTVRTRRRTPAVMFQGTSSNAGKSVLTAAFCRILLQDGYRVAPFKAQNMSLNSFVTADGGEMGRAQVMQAQACRIEPDVRMNPVLLKPNSDVGSQVVVLGKPVCNMDVHQYTSFKSGLVETVKRAYDSLASQYDAVVLEGAGSPAEVNLKHHDIVNMRMARHAAAPVVLVGDIDRGGVYAAFVGTLEVLAEWERRLVAGFIVNRFRGDASILESAHEYVMQHTGRPVLGVVPYLSRLNLPQEDSVEFKSGALDAAPNRDDGVEIAVVDLPHISNFTDFDALRLEPDVRLRVVRQGDSLGEPEAVILPGSKNVIADLEYLRTSGLAEAIKSLAQRGRAEVVGLCGGFQMLGRDISDPHSIESAAGRVSGLGILSVSTALASEKTLTRVRAIHRPSGLPVFGYEIHHGQTVGEGFEALFESDDARPLGAVAAEGRVWGTYIHGVFDADEFRRWFIDRLRERRNLAPVGRPVTAYDLEPAFDRLAEVVRKSVDVERIYHLMGLK